MNYFTPNHSTEPHTAPPTPTAPASNFIPTASPSVLEKERLVWEHHLQSTQPPPAALLNKPSPPPTEARFLHGGPVLSDPAALNVVGSSSSTAPGTVNATTVASSSWRAFSDQEQQELVRAWDALEKRKLDETPKDIKGTEGSEVADPDGLPAAHIVPVGIDKLFSVDLTTLLLSPDFWDGAPVLCMRSTWFYAPPYVSEPVPSHLQKVYPVDPELAEELERSYIEIAPFSSTYSDELASVLKSGLSGSDVKLRGDLLGGEINVVWSDGEVGKVFSRTGFRRLGGGQIVLRGWEALQRHGRVVNEELGGDGKAVRPSPSTTASDATLPDPSDPSSATVESDSTTTAPSFFEMIKLRLGGTVPASSTNAAGEIVDNSTEAALNSANYSRAKSSRTDELAEVAELVLVVHGIGQKLASTFESLNFVNAVNNLRTSCDALSASPELSQVLGGSRVQFVPIRWRTDLVFDDLPEDEEGEADEVLGNRFSLEDIEVGSIPLLRSVISGLVLDVPFYLSHHKSKMTTAVVRDANRVYRLFCQRNPYFALRGRVSIIAHSLGSALVSDVLSTQPTRVKKLLEMTPAERGNEKDFLFDTRLLFLVGSPLAFFLHLNNGQLIARAGRARTEGVGPDIALKRSGRNGCMSIDALYNIYATSDPVAYSLNAAVDRSYSKKIKPISIQSSNKTLMERLGTTYERVSKLFDVAALFGGSGEQQEEQEIDEIAGKNKAGKSKRPGGGMKRMPSERAKGAEVKSVTRAEQRFKALNPQGSIDFELQSLGINEYVDALTSHSSYWSDQRLHSFILTQLFASEEDLEWTGREENGVIDEEGEEEREEREE